MRAPIERAALGVALAGVALAACTSRSAQPSPSNDASVSDRLSCVPDARSPAVPIVHLGPDVDVAVLCGSSVSVPIASLSNQGALGLDWHLSTDAPPDVFMPGRTGGVECPSGQTVVVTVDVTPPESALSGDVLVGTFTISAPHGEFPAGTVKVTAHVVVPEFTLEPTEIDFGDVVEYERAQRSVTFHNPTDETLSAFLPRPPELAFGFETASVVVGRGLSFTIPVLHTPVPAGDYAAEATWVSPPPKGGKSLACTVTRTLKVRAHVVPRPDGGSEDARAD